MRVGVFGGTFDPPHAGHLIVAQDAALALELDRVLFVPAAVPPHKRNRVVTPAPLRLRMLELALGGDERFAVDPLELEREGASWTVDTMRELAAREPDTRWTLLMGADQYAEFATWREPDAIRAIADIAVLTRAGAGIDATGTASPHRPAVHGLDHGDVAIEATRIDISATAIRRRVEEGLSIRYLVPRAVEEFIFEQKLYVRNGTGAAG